MVPRPWACWATRPSRFGRRSKPTVAPGDGAPREGAALLGRSLLNCHNADSQRRIIDILAAFEAGAEERRITDNEKHRIYMRAVRDSSGRLLGCYERYEPPVTGGRSRT
ncbi:MAG: hypothetical protein AB1601_01495 [Planctomycetota bacterium]